MVDEKDATVTIELERRLEDLFGEGDEPQDLFEGGSDVDSPSFMALQTDDATVSIEDGARRLDPLLKDLKSIILSLDWEITDEVMTKLIEQVEMLKDHYHNDKGRVLLLQLLGSVGKYINTHKSKAHPSAIKVLNSEYNSLETLILSKDMKEEEKRRLLTVELRKFKDLKAQIAARKAASGESKYRHASGAHGHALSHEAFLAAFEDLKRLIEREFQNLKAQLDLQRAGH